MSEKFAADTSRRSVRQWALGLLILLIGLTIAHFGVTLFLLSDLGSDTFTVLVQGLADVIGISIGTCHVIVLVILVVLMLIFTRGYVKPGTVVCAVCGGWIIDFFLWAFGDSVGSASPLWLRVILMCVGCIVLAFGMSVVIQSRSGTGPNDLIAIIASDTLGKKLHLQFRWVRLLCDVIFVAVGWALGGVVGAGTIVAAFLTGPVVQFFLPISDRIIGFFMKDDPARAEGQDNEAKDDPARAEGQGDEAKDDPARAEGQGDEAKDKSVPHDGDSECIDGGVKGR